MPIWLRIEAHSGIPIYIQIIEQITHAIRVGALTSGEQLPTVRQLASELTIAPNTIVKAYNELQRIGFISSRAGVGTIVSISEQHLSQLKLDSLHERLRELVRDALATGIEGAEIQAMLTSILEEPLED